MIRRQFGHLIGMKIKGLFELNFGSICYIQRSQWPINVFKWPHLLLYVMNFNETWHMNKVQREKTEPREIRALSPSLKRVISVQSGQS